MAIGWRSFPACPPSQLTSQKSQECACSCNQQPDGGCGDVSPAVVRKQLNAARCELNHYVRCLHEDCRPTVKKLTNALNEIAYLGAAASFPKADEISRIGRVACDLLKSSTNYGLHGMDEDSVRALAHAIRQMDDLLKGQ